MTLIGKVETEVEIQAPAAKFYNVFRKQLEHVPNIATHIHGAKVHEGDWENIGSVKHWEFTIDGKKLSSKAKTESIDDYNKVITYSIIFDGEVSDNYKSLKTIIQVIDKEHGGIVKWTYEYEKLKEEITVLSPESMLEFSIKITKDIDAHLVKK